jgi:hypothetical protein
VYIADLACDTGHRFEGWYDSAAELEALVEGGELTCPLCEGPAHRVPTASRISTSKTQRAPPLPEATPGAPPKMPLEMQKALAKVLQQVRQTHEDVGTQFADKALAIHKGEAPPQLIRGEATPAEEERLIDEGVPFLKLPVPEIEEN